tara:strand:+ start:51 stop:923 length:873 start_codon:yes stop_codon:yes gene_type:complete
MTNIIEINQDEFVSKVIEKSKTIPILVDFWAPWCGPCKQLTPILEKLVQQQNGKIILAKINVDENQSLAAQLNIQSIPTVYGFVDGRPVDAFQGAQPESKIQVMIKKLIDLTPGNEIPKLLEEAESLFKENQFDQSKNIFEQLIGMDPGNPNIISGLLRCLLKLEAFDEAKEIISSLEEEVLQNDEITKISQLLNNLNDDNDDEEELHLIEARIKENPEDLSLRFQLSEKFLKNNSIENGFNELLYIYDKNPNWNDQAAKKKLLEYFDLLGFNDPNVADARKRLSAMMFK